MDQPEQTQQQQQQQPPPSVVGVVPGGQMAYSSPYQTVPVTSTTQPPTTFLLPSISLPTNKPNTSITTAAAAATEQLQLFWSNQMQEIEQTTDFKNHSLPLARIKKIMKADEDVRMISAEAPVVFAKACEMFILELTLRSWIHTEENKRRTLQKNDIAAAISRTDVFDFLVDIIPRDELKEEGLGVTKATIPLVGSPADSIPYYYVPTQQQPVGPTGMIVGKPVDQVAMYAASGGQQQQPRPPAAFMPWPRPQPQPQTQQHQTQQQQSETS